MTSVSECEAEGIAVFFETFVLLEIVDLAIEHDLVAVEVTHRLVSEG